MHFISSKSWLAATFFLGHALLSNASAAEAQPTLEAAWENPPHEARLGAYWWWLNGNVTREAITSDLEAMRDMGFGHAVIFDADGAAQHDNDPVPPGPTFASPEWRKLYKHALTEASRTGITLSLNIQSGWNIGGPDVTPDDAAKITVWSEVSAQGPGPFVGKLPVPDHKNDHYRDSHVIAWRTPPPSNIQTRTSSEQDGREARYVCDEDSATFWVSEGTKPGEGPSEDAPEWIDCEFVEAVTFDEVRILPRPRYGPSRGEIRISDDGKEFRSVTEFTATRSGLIRIRVPESTAKVIRIVIHGAHAPSGKSAKNVQIAEVAVWSGKDKLTGGSGPPGMLKHKNLQARIRGSAPDLSYLLSHRDPLPGEVAIRPDGVLDLTSKLEKDGTLRWTVPEGEWTVLRFGSTIGPRAKVSTSSADWKGYALDVFDKDAFRRYWDSTVVPLIDDAGPLAGPTLKYLHTDSWEIEPVNWTSSLPEEFRKRRGYEIGPWLPVIAGHIVESREASTRFLNDFRRTLGDLAVDHHYKPFREWAQARGLGIHPEAGGPHVVPIDAQQCLGIGDAPMSEFWAESWRHRVGDPARFFVKQPASAAHTNGRPLVMAEGFTTVGPHWQERLWNNLKPSFDKACTEGLNALVWHAWVCSPESTGVPGQQYFAGTHLNPKVTWWTRGKPFFAYINRCQALLQRGFPVSDVLYYYGDRVPNFTQLRAQDPAGVGQGFDYDVISADVLLARVTVKDGRLVLPEGTSYAMLMLPDLDAISLPVLHKVRELVDAGATVAGPQPTRISGLDHSGSADAEVLEIAKDLWSDDGQRRVENVDGAREMLDRIGLAPDFTFTGASEEADISYIHRRDGDTEIYFVASRGEAPETLSATFRVSGRIPEAWDPVSGRRTPLAVVAQDAATTEVRLHLDPCGSVFVIFREGGEITEPGPAPSDRVVMNIDGTWTVSFDPKWGGSANALFDELLSWTEHSDFGIRHYSGTATYRKTFEFPAAVDPKTPHLLDLGDLAELAEVRLNGERLGILWTPPFRLDVTGALKAGSNQLEVDVVNFWPNRLIGDASLPESKRFATTNIRSFTKDSELMKSGLFGPVRILTSR